MYGAWLQAESIAGALVMHVLIVYLWYMKHIFSFGVPWALRMIRTTYMRTHILMHLRLQHCVSPFAAETKTRTSYQGVPTPFHWHMGVREGNWNCTLWFKMSCSHNETIAALWSCFHSKHLMYEVRGRLLWCHCVWRYWYWDKLCLQVGCASFETCHLNHCLW